MNELPSSNTTTEEYDDYGKKTVTNTSTKIFPTAEEAHERARAVKPLYLKHAFPRDGTVDETIDVDGTTYTFKYLDAEANTLKIFHRVYREATHAEKHSPHFRS